MRKNIRLMISGFLLTAATSAAAAEPELPKVEILGKEYYYHEIKKGESIYGIAKQHGWDLDELVRLNPTTASDMAKGSRLYYPTGRVTVVKEIDPQSQQEAPAKEPEPIRHLVKRGETVYGIARQYNIPVETIYASCPNAKYGIKAGETLEIRQPSSSQGGFLYYEIKPGDTLYGLSQRYHTSVEDILKANPGISERNFKSGDTVRIAVNSNARRIHTELVEEERVASLDSYKVGKKDDWNSIAEKTGVAVETLKEANENVGSPRKNDVVNIPVIETVKVEKEYVESDPREQTAEGIRELYDSIHNVSGTEELNRVKVALILDDPASKKDIEFTRGFLTALDGMKDTPYKIDFKVIDGRGNQDKTTAVLKEYEPTIVISTADKDFPVYLAELGDSNGVEVVNVFDLKNELSEGNQSIIQLLPSATYFNQQIGEELAGSYGNRRIVVVGGKDSGDGIAEVFLSKVPASNVDNVSVSNLSTYTISPDKEYLFYCYPTRKDEVADILQGVENLKENEPFADIVVIGRQNWVTLADSYADKFGEAGVIIPSRVWFDTESSAGKKFIRTFNSLFGAAPMKSFPNFAASGYDVANFFIPSAAKNGGDFNKKYDVTDKEMVQSEIRLDRVSNWGGFINQVGYLVRFRPGGYIERIMLK